MAYDTQQKQLNKLTLGIVAHVDAGKTTLAESMLYLTGEIRQLGRVDHQDAFLDTYDLEKSRGITIFSKQARFGLSDFDVTLLDTPGHVDFSAEMERTLQVLDYAILVISAADGVNGHVITLWRLLKEYNVPVYLFVNKMDQEGADRERLLQELHQRLDENCIDFSADVERDSDFYEKAAVTDEELLEYYLENGIVEKEQIREQIRQRRLFPCFFGSALKVQGVRELLDEINDLCIPYEGGEKFGARVFKISRDAQGKRLTYMKITGGSLFARQVIGSEKVDQIRLYSGSSFIPVPKAEAGTVCAVTGLNETFTGQGLGCQEEADAPVLEPVLSYCISFPQGTDMHDMYRKLLQIEEEEPQLRLVWQEETGEIHANVMGEVQIEILQDMIEKRFGVSAEFASGSIIYKETITSTVEGIGHFEPLRHYAEVHLLMEPGEPGSGCVFSTDCSEDILNRNWQRLILTHLEEKKHRGVLTGSELTDVRITLINGRAHIKHTEGGDFRQATYRAVRQGLMQAKSRLLEPVYKYRLQLPSECIGRAMNDIQQMCGTFSSPEQEGELYVLTGTAPVSEMRGYQREVVAYTRGRGQIFCTLKGYEPCHNEEQVIEQFGYIPEADLANTPDSVFCAHGAGFAVPWYEVPQYMHLEGMDDEDEETVMLREAASEAVRREKQPEKTRLDYEAENEELKAIFERTYGPVKKYSSEDDETIRPVSVKKVRPYKGTKVSDIDEYLLVDGYNIIFAWPALSELAKINIDAARLKLMDIMSNYQGAVSAHIILVFDAYKVKGGQGSVEKFHNIHVVYTREAETADQYIEKTVHAIGRRYRVTVATSDGLEQVIILGQGGTRLSAAGLLEAVEAAAHEIRTISSENADSGKVYLFHNISGETAEEIERVRRGEKEGRQ